MNNWRSKLKNTFTIILKNMNYLGLNMTKYMEDLYSENYKTVFRKIKEDQNK